MDPATVNLFAGCISAGCVLGAVIALVNSWLP